MRLFYGNIMLRVNVNRISANGLLKRVYGFEQGEPLEYVCYMEYRRSHTDEPWGIDGRSPWNGRSGVIVRELSAICGTKNRTATTMHTVIGAIPRCH